MKTKIIDFCIGAGIFSVLTGGLNPFSFIMGLIYVAGAAKGREMMDKRENVNEEA